MSIFINKLVAPDYVNRLTNMSNLIMNTLSKLLYY